MRKVASVQRMARRLLSCGRNKLWIDPNEKERVAAVQNYEQVKQLVEDNIILKRQDKFNSRAHARKLVEGRAKGRRMGLGKRKGTKEARLSSKTIWMKNIRSMRTALKDLKKKGELAGEEYRMYYVQAKGNLFKNKNVMVDAIMKKKAEVARLRELGLQAEALKMSKSN
jgi:large subunit ribosomal protein L19e